MLTRKLGSPSGCGVLTVGYSPWNNNSFCVGGRCHEIIFLVFLLNYVFSFVHAIACYNLLISASQPQHTDLPGGLQVVWGGDHGWAVASRAKGGCWQEPVP